MANAQSYPSAHLLSLAPELRLLIYEFLWTGTQPAEVHIKSDDSRLCCVGTKFDGKRQLPPSRWPDNRVVIDENTYSLLKTCRLIHNEATPVAYEKTHFDVLVSCAGDSKTMKPVWQGMDFLAHAVSVSVGIDLFRWTFMNTRMDHALLLAQLQDLDHRLPEHSIRRMLVFPLCDPETLTERNLATYAGIKWRGDVVLEIHTRTHARYRSDPVTAGRLAALLEMRKWWVVGT